MDMSSFSELLRRQAPAPAARGGTGRRPPSASDALPHGTTIVAMKFPGGVADRR